MSLFRYIIKRLLISIPMFIGVIVITWMFIGFIPGHPIDRFLAEMTSAYGPSELAAVRQKLLAKYGLDKPWYLQLTDFFFGMFTGNWGLSIAFKYQDLQVFDLIKVWFPRTLEVAILPMIIVNVIAAKLGKYTAVNRGKAGDHIVRGFALMLVSLPSFWVALVLQYSFREMIPNITFNIIDIPVVGLFSNSFAHMQVPFVTGFRTIDTLLNNQLTLFWDTVMHLIVPTTVFFIATFGHMLRPARSCMLDVLESDYIRTARSKGCSEQVVMDKHAFRNSIIPYSTFIGFNIGYFISGAAYIELIFDFKGIGQGIIYAFVTTDYFMIRGCLVVFCVINIVVNLVVDVMYAVLDPRISFD
ncbi:MAG: ABC transporter permease [Promethearchaeota archaeon]